MIQCSWIATRHWNTWNKQKMWFLLWSGISTSQMNTFSFYRNLPKLSEKIKELCLSGYGAWHPEEEASNLLLYKSKAQNGKEWCILYHIHWHSKGDTSLGFAQEVKMLMVDKKVWKKHFVAWPRWEPGLIIF